MSTPNPILLWAPGQPEEWKLPDELRARFFPGKLLFTPEEAAELKRIQQSRYFLVKNELGAKCRECGAVHSYLSQKCLEFPFNGWDQLLLLEQRLTEEQGRLHGEAVRATQHVLLATNPGAIVPITAREAQKLAIRIQLRGRPVPTVNWERR